MKEFDRMFKVPIVALAAYVLGAAGCDTQQGSSTALMPSFAPTPFPDAICGSCPDFDQPKTPTAIPSGRYAGPGEFVFTQTVLEEAQEFSPINSPVTAVFGQEGEPLHEGFEYWPIAAGNILRRDPETGVATHEILSVEKIDEGVVVRTKLVWPITVEPLSLPAELTETYTKNVDGTLTYEATGFGSSEDGSVSISLRANGLLAQ